MKPASSRKRKLSILPNVLACVPFGGVAYVCKYVLPGYSFTAFVCLGIVGIILFYTFMPVVGQWFPRFARTVTILATVALLLGLTAAGITEYFVQKASLGTAREPVEYLVVLGAKVNPNGPSVSLQDRIDAAYAYLTAHPETVAVVSGGKGADEPMSEAECMARVLTAKGIPEEQIWLEDRASSTDENLRFSLALIAERTGQKPAKIGVLSSEYHLLRAELMTRKLNVGFVGVPARTSRFAQWVNHSMREVAAVWKFMILGR